eukprot:4806748-Alexandrium_andersonii.AAC.1
MTTGLKHCSTWGLDSCLGRPRLSVRPEADVQGSAQRLRKAMRSKLMPVARRIEREQIVRAADEG